MVTKRQRRRVSDETSLRGIFTIERLIRVCMDLNRARYGRHIYRAANCRSGSEPRVARRFCSMKLHARCCGSGSSGMSSNTEYVLFSWVLCWVAKFSQIATPIVMQMVFTNLYVGAPILFQQWTPRSTGGFVGSFFAIVVAAFVMRLLIFSRSYLNSQYWCRSKVASICGIAV